MGEQFPIPFGRYQLVERLAVGGMAELFVGTAPGEHGFAKKVVIKRLLPHLSVDANYTQMFIDEAKLTARLVHPKIAQTHELGRQGNELFIAMEYVEGFDVLAMLRECAARREQLEHHIAVWIAREVLDALDYAHQAADTEGQSLGVVHRDISPSNVLLSIRGDVKLIDFGIARAHDPQRAQTTKSGTLKGKYGYMSPEQVVEQPLDPRTDLFSVGVVLAEMLTGRRLFAAANELDVLLMVRDARLTRLDKYGEGIDPGLDVVVRRALKKGLDERWQTAAEFRDALDEWLFMQRRRVSAKMVADLVAVLRDGVIAQRAKDAAEQPLELAEPPRAVAAVAAAAAAAEQVARKEASDPAMGVPRHESGVRAVPVMSTIAVPPITTTPAPPAATPRPTPRPAPLAVSKAKAAGSLPVIHIPTPGNEAPAPALVAEDKPAAVAGPDDELDFGNLMSDEPRAEELLARVGTRDVGQAAQEARERPAAARSPTTDRAPVVPRTPTPLSGRTPTGDGPAVGRVPTGQAPPLIGRASTGDARPAMGRSPTPEPSVLGRTPTPVPSRAPTGDPRPARTQTPERIDRVPQVGRAPTVTPPRTATPSAPAIPRAPTPTPTVSRTQTPAPAVSRTQTPAPAVSRTQTPAPAVSRTQTPAPALTRAPTSVPVVARAPTSAPSAPTVARTATTAPAAPLEARTSTTDGSRPMIARTTTFEARLAAEPAGELDLFGPDGADLDLGDLPASNFPSIEAAIESLMPASTAVDTVDDGAFGAPARASAQIAVPQVPSAQELARKKPPTPPSIQEITDEPDDSGEFSDTPPLTVLFRLMTAKSTGLLTVHVGGIKKEIYFREGQPEYVSSNVASELFGAYLVSKGVMSDGELAMALAMMPHYGGKLGDTLVGLGLLKPLEVFRHLTRQVRSKIIDVCTWNKGQFSWYAGRENHREAFPLDLNTYEVLGAGAMALPVDTLDAWIERNREVRLRAARGKRIGPDRFEIYRLDDVFESLDGKRTVGEILDGTTDKVERTRTARLLYLLECVELARAA